MHTVSAHARNVEEAEDPMDSKRSSRQEPGTAGQVFLALAFLAFVALGIVTVILPELENVPEEEATRTGESATDEGSSPAPAR